MGLFDKKFCDICGNKIGLLGNRKLEDGNLCKDCAAKLSPWFSERRHSSVAEIKAQLEYREANREAVANFHASRTVGKNYKLMIDEAAKKWLVTRATDLKAANPDVLDYAQVKGCETEIEEDLDELKRTVEGKEVSYNPPRYDHSYDFHITIQVDAPYFDEIEFRLNGSSVETGTRSMKGPDGGWLIDVSAIDGEGVAEYNEYAKMLAEMKELFEGMQKDASGEAAAPAEEAPAQPAPQTVTAIRCPWCGTLTEVNESHRCEHCGGPLDK